MRTAREPLPGMDAPLAVRWLTVLTIVSSCYVKVEPAPTDLMFTMLFAVVFVIRTVRLKGISGMTILGAVIFTVGNLVSLAVTPTARDSC